MRAKLTALYQGKKQSRAIEGFDSLEVTCKAIKYILDKAVNNELWAKGKIVLQDERGNILKEMTEK